MPAWEKWRPSQPTSPHWYTRDRFTALLAAYLSEDRRQGRVRTVREVVAEFDGLSGSVAQKKVTSDAGLSRATLEDLVCDGHMDAEAVSRLLQAMQTRARTIKPYTLGVLGAEHLRAALVQQFAVEPDSVKYK